MTRLFHGARQGTQAAIDAQQPGLTDPANPSRLAKASATQGAEALSIMGHGRVTPQFAAATMHNSMSDDAKQIAEGYKNVPIHPSQIPTEGSDGQETEGDGSVRDPTGIGRGT